MKEYKQRIVDNILKRKLECKGSLVIEEPMWCGKTTTAEQFFFKYFYIWMILKKGQNIAMSEITLKLLLNGN
ncbi:MAG: hypothetical protein L6U99_07115 [Clostridium sp.]|nr:MAG: hypothetical protein L6U99_07115 [Clostridium sp.]